MSKGEAEMFVLRRLRVARATHPRGGPTDRALEMGAQAIEMLAGRCDRLTDERDAARAEAARLRTGQRIVATEYADLEAEAARLREALPPPEKLRTVADWLDTYDSMAALWLDAMQRDERVERALAATQGKEVQADLRAWADRIDALTADQGDRP